MAAACLLFVITGKPPSTDVSISMQTPFARGSFEFLQLEEIVASFQGENPQIQVRLLPDGPTADDVITRRTLLRGAPDVFEIPLRSISGPAGRGTILSAIDVLAEGVGDVFPWALRAAEAEHDNTIYAVPFRARSVQLIYNGSILRKSGFRPANPLLINWTELLETCRAISEFNKENGCSALGVSGRDPESISQLGLMLAGQMNVELMQIKEGAIEGLGPVWRVTINSDDGVRALRMVRQLGEYIPPEALEWSRDDLLREFIAQRVAMFFGCLRDVERIRAEAPDLDLWTAEAPVEKSDASCVDFYGAVVRATTAHPDACKKLLAYLCGPDAQEMIMKGGQAGLPMFSPVRSEFLDHEWYDDNAIYEPFLKALTYPCTCRRVSAWAEVRKQAFVPVLKKLIAGETEATDAAERIEELGNLAIGTHYGYIGSPSLTSQLGMGLSAAGVFLLIFFTVGHRAKH